MITPIADNKIIPAAAADVAPVLGLDDPLAPELALLVVFALLLELAESVFEVVLLLESSVLLDELSVFELDSSSAFDEESEVDSVSDELSESGVESGVGSDEESSVFSASPETAVSSAVFAASMSAFAESSGSSLAAVKAAVSAAKLSSV